MTQYDTFTGLNSHVMKQKSLHNIIFLHKNYHSKYVNALLAASYVSLFIMECFKIIDDIGM